MWDEIDRAFNVAGKPVIFAWGDTIYNPEGVPLSKELHAHEEIHGARQLAHLPDDEHLAGVEGWWQRYIADAGFRLLEEIPAHHAEYRAFCKRHAGTSARQNALRAIASKLASPLYGGLVSTGAAVDMVLLGRAA